MREPRPPYLLQVRVGLGHDVESVLAPALSAHVRSRRLVAMSTAKQGMAIEATYRIELQKEPSAGELCEGPQPDRGRAERFAESRNG